jgi:hypothetical protein
MIYLLKKVDYPIIQKEVEITTMDDLWIYSRGYEKVVVDFEMMTIYLYKNR